MSVSFVRSGRPCAQVPIRSKGNDRQVAFISNICIQFDVILTETRFSTEFEVLNIENYNTFLNHENNQSAVTLHTKEKITRIC